MNLPLRYGGEKVAERWTKGGPTMKLGFDNYLRSPANRKVKDCELYF